MEKLLMEALDQVTDLTSQPHMFLDPLNCDSHFNKAKAITKVLYDATKLVEGECRLKSDHKTDPDFMKTLPELIIDDFDAEQVWAGVTLQNKTKFEKLAQQIEILSRYSSKTQRKDKITNHANNDLKEKTRKFDFNLLIGGSRCEDIESRAKLGHESDQDEDLHELSISQTNKQKLEDNDSESGLEEGTESESDDKNDDDQISNQNEEEDNTDEMENDEEGRESEDIYNDPDFQHMSDSDLDDLPLAQGESEDEDENIPDEQLKNIDADSERKSKNREARERKQKEVNAQTDEYMQNALSSLRSLSGNVKSKEFEEKPLSEASKVEDDFFKIDEMEAFLDDQDAKENRKAARQEKGLPEEDDDNLDLFGDDWNGEDEEARRVTFKDFQVDDDKEAIGSKTVNEVRDEESNPNSENESSNESDTGRPDTGMKRLLSEDEDEDLGEVKSTHELRQLRLKKKIKKMEQEAIGQVEGLEKNGSKMWQMKGEITAVDRPENSLLQEHLEYDTVSKQAPVITEQVSKRLEDIIMQRIKDQAYDDVQRKIKPIENPYEYKKKLILDQEKSKLSLAEVYEQAYLKQKSSLEESAKKPGMLDDEGTEQTPKEVESIKKSMKILFSKLDSLTHFHFTPKSQGTAEIKVIKNTATLSMEEVAPVAMSDANLLAPQEIIDRNRGEEIGSSERAETDKKRDRRRKKALQSKRQKENEKREKAVDKLNPGLGNKYSKARVMKELENAEKQGGQLKRIKEDTMKGKSVKSSTAFFNQLQNDAINTVKQVKSSKNKHQSNKKISSSNLKL